MVSDRNKECFKFVTPISRTRFDVCSDRWYLKKYPRTLECDWEVASIRQKHCSVRTPASVRLTSHPTIEAGAFKWQMVHLSRNERPCSQPHYTTCALALLVSWMDWVARVVFVLATAVKQTSFLATLLPRSSLSSGNCARVD